MGGIMCCAVEERTKNDNMKKNVEKPPTTVGKPQLQMIHSSSVSGAIKFILFHNFYVFQTKTDSPEKLTGKM